MLEKFQQFRCACGVGFTEFSAKVCFHGRDAKELANGANRWRYLSNREKCCRWLLKHHGGLEELKKADLAKKDPSGEVVLTENGKTLLSEMKLQPKVMKRSVIDTDGRPTFLDDLLGEL